MMTADEGPLPKTTRGRMRTPKIPQPREEIEQNPLIVLANLSSDGQRFLPSGL
jgi:hypothetical protein